MSVKPKLPGPKTDSRARVYCLPEEEELHRKREDLEHLIDDVREAVSAVDRKVSPDELAALVVRLTRAAIERGFSEFEDYTAYAHGMISGKDPHLSKIAEHIESAWRMLGQCKEFSHIDPAGNVAQILEQREREQWETIYRRGRHCLETAYLQARDLAIEGNLDGAIAEYTEVIKFLPVSGLGPEQTETIYLQIRHFLETVCLQARDFAIEGNLDLAIAECTKVIKFVPDYAGGYYGRARAYLWKKDFDLAIADYSEAIRLVRRFEEAYWGRGEAYLKKGDHAKAESDFAEAKRLGYKP